MEEKLDKFFSVIILGTEEQNVKFINGFLNFFLELMKKINID